MRSFVPPIPDYAPGEYDLHHVKLRFVSVPKSQLKITNDFEKFIKPVIDAASRHTTTQLKVPADHLILPVHELQIAHIQDKFPEIEVLPAEFAVSANAQQSIRCAPCIFHHELYFRLFCFTSSVQVPDASSDILVKLPIGLKLTQYLRTISTASAWIGPRFSDQVIPHLKLDPDVVIIANELASVVHAHPDKQIAKHCAAIIREAHEINSEERGERHIVCSALVESGHAGEGGHLPAVIRIFQLDTEEKRRDWLDRFGIYFSAWRSSNDLY